MLLSDVTDEKGSPTRGSFDITFKPSMGAVFKQAASEADQK